MFRSAPMRAARGVSLIEVLVAIVIFSLGLIGLALMELKGATFTKESGARTMAVLQARSLADRMEANPVGVADGAYDWNKPGIPPYKDCSSSACSADDVALNDLAEWLLRIKASAPASATAVNFGSVTDNKDGTWTITVSWNGLIDLTGGGNSDVSESVVFIPGKNGAGS
jgi:type IV pilus assembly protein PilV